MTTSIVTGASRGLGHGIAGRLVAAGHDVLAVARTTPTVNGARNVAADVTSAGDVRRLVGLAPEGIALLVNNAAAPLVLDSLADLTRERFMLGFEVDVAGTLAVTQAAAPHLGGGTVVNVIAARGGALTGPPHLSICPRRPRLRR